MARPLCGFQIQMIQSPHIYQWMGMSVSFGKHWAKCCQDHLVSLSKQLPLTPRNNSSTVALLRPTHFFWPKIHGVRGIDFVAKLERVNFGYNWSINVGVALLANLSAMWPALRPYWEASRIAMLYPRLILMCSYLSGDGLSSFVFELHIVCCHTSCSSRTGKTKIFFVFSPNLI